MSEYDAIAIKLYQLEKLEAEKEQRRLDEVKRLQARNEELELQVEELEAEIAKLKKPNICYHHDHDVEDYYKEDEASE